MKICKKCGNKLSDESKKCEICKTNSKDAIQVDANDTEKINEIINSIKTMNSAPKKKGKGCLIAIAVVVVLFIIGAIIGGGGDDKPSSTKTPSANEQQEDTADTKVDEPEVIITAEEMSKAYDENELNGNTLYKDKDVQVTGTISSFGEVLGQTYVTLKGYDEWSIVSVQCFFENEDDIATLATLKEGDAIIVRGTCDGMSINVSIDDCELVQ